MSGRNRSALPASYQFSALAKDLHRMGPETRRKLGNEFLRIGQAALSDARSRAGAWSSQIPSAISGRATVTANRLGFELRVSRRVPHARPYEGISQQGSTAYFRHPVFGNTEVWRSQKTRPYLWPAVRGREADMRRSVGQAYEDAARECGFR